MGPVLDGVPAHMADYPDAQAFRVAKSNPVDVTRLLKESGAEVLVSYLPVGSEDATKHYATACLEAGVGMVNCIPVFIASNPEWAEQFKKKNVPIVGDDIKSQVGATIVHRTLARLMADRGVKLERTYQLDTSGETDFLNMLEEERLKTKRISKTESVQSQLDARLPAGDIHIGPSDYVAWRGTTRSASSAWSGWASATSRCTSRPACPSRTLRTAPASPSTPSASPSSPRSAASVAPSSRRAHT